MTHPIFSASHTCPCDLTLDAFDRCTQCLIHAGRLPNSPWQIGDDQYVPPARKLAWKTRQIQ